MGSAADGRRILGSEAEKKRKERFSGSAADRPPRIRRDQHCHFPDPGTGV